MKKYILSILIMLLLAAPSFAAESLKFSWSPHEQADILTGFRLYRDGINLEPVVIPPTATTVTVPRQTDKKSHAYHLTAFSDTEESGPSQTAIDEYSIKVHAVGNLTFEIIKD